MKKIFFLCNLMIYSRKGKNEALCITPEEALLQQHIPNCPWPFNFLYFNQGVKKGKLTTPEPALSGRSSTCTLVILLHLLEMFLENELSTKQYTIELNLTLTYVSSISFNLTLQ